MDANAASSTSTNVNNNGNVVVSGAASSVVVPPPPYSVAVAAEPLTFNFQVPSEQQPSHTHQMQDQSQLIESPSTQTHQDNSENDLGVDTPESSIIARTAPHAEPLTTTTIQIIEVAPAPSSGGGNN